MANREKYMRGLKRTYTSTEREKGRMLWTSRLSKVRPGKSTEEAGRVPTGGFPPEGSHPSLLSFV